MKTLDADHVIVGGGIAGFWLARGLLSHGRSVLMIETGPRLPNGARPARPPIRFPERENLGAIRARNQALTGNSSFWGGALIRNDAGSLRRMFDCEPRSDVPADLARAYDAVESQIGAPTLTRRDLEDTPVPARLAEVNVLPGRKRNLANAAWRFCASHPAFELLCPADVTAFERGADGRIAAVIAQIESGASCVVNARHCVLTAGVVDTNILALTKLATALEGRGLRVGTHLHDHWSLPIARFHWRSSAEWDWLYPPTFRNGFIQGRRVEIEAELPWGIHAGFLHVQAQYDLIEPYATIKSWMSARQEGEPAWRQARFLPPLARQSLRMARIGYSRVVHGRLFVEEGMELTVVMDFESSADPSNRLAIEDGEHRLYWDLRERDLVAFAALRRQGIELIRSWASQGGLDVEWLAASDDLDAQHDYLDANAVDAYHLGGGLTVSRDAANGLLAPDLSFHGIPNLSVVGTAAFARPGIANPVETLLAMCDRYVSNLR